MLIFSDFINSRFNSRLILFLFQKLLIIKIIINTYKFLYETLGLYFNIYKIIKLL